MKLSTVLLLFALQLCPLTARDKWFIAIKHNRGQHFNLENYTPIFPPNGRFYADPMLIEHEGKNYIFFEDFDYRKGVISYVSVDNSLNVSSPKVALETKTHLSFPFLFKEGASIYMIPESYRAGEIALYESSQFPDQWKKNRVLVQEPGFDTVLFKHDGYYWIITSIQPEILQIYYSKNLFSEFIPHPMNKKRIKGRNAGNIIFVNGKILRPNMVSEKTYGHHIVIKEITDLTPTTFQEKDHHTIWPDWAPNLRGTHTFNMNKELVIFDGKVTNRPFPTLGLNRKYRRLRGERTWITRKYLPSLRGRVLFVGVASYTRDYHKYVKNPRQFETIDIDPNNATNGSPYKHHTEDFLKFDPGYKYDHISLFGVLGKHDDPRSGEIYNIDSQKMITAALETAKRLLKPNGTLMIGPEQASFKPSNKDVPHINANFWKNRLNQHPLDTFEIKFIAEGRNNLIWWGTKKD